MKDHIKSILFIYLFLFSISVQSIASPQDLPKHTVTDIKIRKITEYVSKVYKQDKTIVTEIVNQAFMLGNKSAFPTPIDILAVIAIESRFNPMAKSSANAKGLMQILYKDSTYNIQMNMLDGVYLMQDYAKRLPIDSTIQAYNVGISSYKSGVRNPEYLAKFKQAKMALEKIS